MPNPENVKKHEFKKGQSGNPKGRPKGSRNIATVLKEMLEVMDQKAKGLKEGEGEYGAPIANELISMIFKKHQEGRKKGEYIHSEATRLRAMEQIMDRLEGKAHLPISIGNEEDKPNFSITFRNGDSANRAAEVQRNKPETD